MMWTSYDPEADAFYAQFAPEGTVVAETREVSPGVMIDVDASGTMIGIEVLSVRTRGATAHGAALPNSASAMAS